jgi:hypothetical protein
MKLTPTGYEDHIYTPGQVDIGETSNGGQGNQLVLIVRSASKSKEAFLDAAANSDHTDHRCLTQDQNQVAIDVRLVLTLPDYQTPASESFQAFAAQRSANLSEQIASGAAKVLVDHGVPLRLVDVQSLEHETGWHGHQGTAHAKRPRSINGEVSQR